MPSTADASDPNRPLPAAPLLTAVRQLAERDVYGLVWIGADLIVDSTYGNLARFVAIGEPLTSSVYALAGMEEDIKALQGRPGDVIELPDITLVTPEGRRPRATLSLSWSKDESAYMLLVARTESRSDLEVELTAQMRARLIAESELAAKTRELQRVNLELERANADLESYASVMSHDLQSPLRVLRYTLDDLDEMTAATAPEVREKIGKLRQLSQRMTAMLFALLDYASITRKTDAIAPVDTAALMRAIVASLDSPAGMTVTIAGNWPVVDTMAAPLDLVLRNLIDNAVKHHDRTTGRIIVSASITASKLTIAIADDGPGIPPEHRDAAFLPFRKLGPDRGQPGQGMGLALVRRTVEAAGGTIAMESPAPEARGTTFTVHWPIR
jgi:signal transduction histidine kinase